MKKITLILPIVFILGFNNLKAQQTLPDPQTKTLPQKEKYALAISFISIGNGIDRVSYDKIENYIKNHPKKPVNSIEREGREGEKTIYLKLTELSKKERKAFIEDVEKLIVNKDLVKIHKNYEAKTVKGK